MGRIRSGVGGILLVFGVGMLDLVQRFVGVACHRDVNSTAGLIPLKGEAVEKRSKTFDGDGV